MASALDVLEATAGAENDGTAARMIGGQWFTVVHRFGAFRYSFGRHEITRDEALTLLEQGELK